VDRMSALDSWFLHVEDDVNHMHIGSVGVFAGPPPTFEELRSAIDDKLDLIPRYRQRYQEVARGMARPVWVDDPHFELDYHVRHTALPRPGDREQLHRLVGRIMGQQLDRQRPLWETWFVEGLEDDRWAMVSKVHHCIVDGIAGTDLLATVLDTDPEARPGRTGDGDGAGEAAAGSARGSSSPSALQVVTSTARSAVEKPVKAARVVTAPLRSPAAAVTSVAATLKGAGELAGLVKRMPASSLTGPIGPHRRYSTARASLADAKAVKTELGGTINDVVLAAITAGYRDLLASRGELHDDSEVRTMVPVSLRREDQRGELNNLVSAVFVSLPVTASEPAERYQAVRDAMEEVKHSGESVATAALVGASELAPTVFVGLALRGVSNLLHRYQRYITTVTTNVPGPQEPHYLLGHRMHEAYPYVPIAEGLRTGIAIFSYAGNLTFGVTADLRTVPDVDVLADGIGRGMEELVALVR
jgi:diacylglycerol O-acyltransferase / wax synthase